MTFPLIINFAPTGILSTKETTPEIPISVSEIVEDVHQAYELGITIVHLHGREFDGAPTCRVGIYEAIIKGIRLYAPDLVICVSLSGRNFPELKKRASPLTLEGKVKPDMGSLTLSSLNFSRQASVNSPEIIQALAQEMMQRNILPELEVFEPGMINYAKYLIRKKFLSPPYYFNIIVGNVASAQLDPLQIGVLLKELPQSSLWSLGGIGHYQLAANTMGIILNGGVRVGLEDNIYWNKSQGKLASNLDLLRRIHHLASLFERKVMSPAEFRQFYSLERGYGVYGKRAIHSNLAR